MRNKMMFIGIGVVVGLLLATVGSVLAGSLTPTVGPTGAASQMYTLQQIYDRLNSGAAGSKMTAFTEPSSGPGTATMHTLDEVMAKSPAVAANGAGVADVVSGRTFWGLTAGAWGLKTGTAAVGSNVSGSNGSLTFNIPNGFYSGKTATANDSHLVASNIKSGVNIFGVVGTLSLTSMSWPSPRFTDNGNGIVTDNLTGLMWMKDADAGYDCAGPDTGAETWSSALYSASQCNSSAYAGYTDWRLPNVRELHSVIDFGSYWPALPSGYPFTGVQNNWYWTSTIFQATTSNAWDMNLSSGELGITAKTNLNYVWLVRG